MRTAAKGKAKAKAVAKPRPAQPKSSAKAKAEAAQKEKDRQAVKYAVSKAAPSIKDFFTRHKKDPEVAPALFSALAEVKKGDFSSVEALITATESKSVSTSAVTFPRSSA